MNSIIPKWTSGLFVPNQRKIGGIAAQVTISEQERDELVITEHPVEQGAPINDHAYKRPSEVTIRAGWSAAFAGDLSANGNGVYGQLLSWQAALRPFDLYTGKRSYKSMLIQTLTVTTDSHSEFALMADIVCRQIIIVSTKVTQAATNKDPANQADPSSNATPTNNGEQQPKSVGTGSKVQSAAEAAGNYGGTSSGSDFGGGGSILPSNTATSSDPGNPSAESVGSQSPVGNRVEEAIDRNVPVPAQQEKIDNANAMLGAI
jgi:hypothetical protein